MSSSAVAIGADRTLLELKMYFREKEAVFFSFLFPILMLTLFAVVFAGSYDGPTKADGVKSAQFFLPGMIAAGIVLTSFQATALSVATERDDGSLKRLRSTPMPAVSFFLGKVGLVISTSLAQTAILLLVARFAFGVPLPSDGDRWLTFAWVFVLGVASGTVLGIAYSSLASARSAGTVVIGPVLILQFISGVYLPFQDIPGWLKDIASVFPLKWVAQGMRSVFLPESWGVLEMGGGWEHGRTALVLAAWFVGSLVVCVLTFRWYRRGTT